MLELAEGEEQRDVGQAVPGHYHHPHHTQREGRSALVLCRNGFGGGLGRPAAANGQEGLTQYIAALQLPHVYLPFPFSGKPVSSQYLDILLSYWPGLSLVPLSCLIPSCAAEAISTGPTYLKYLDIRYNVYFQKIFSDTISIIGLIICCDCTRLVAGRSAA
jgi:hypothetical protein